MFFAGIGPAAASPAGGAQARVLFDHAGWILAVALAGAAAGTWLAMSAPPQYRAQTLVQVQARDVAVRSVAQAEAAPFDAGVLASRAVIGPVLQRLQMDMTVQPVRAPLVGRVAAYFAEAGKPHGPWPETLRYAWGGERAEVQVFTVPQRLLNVPLTLVVLPNNRFALREGNATLLEGEAGTAAAGNGVQLLVTRIDAGPGTRFTLTRHDLATATDAAARNLTVLGEGGAGAGADRGTVRISFLGPDRDAAAAFVNGIAQSYIAGQTSQRRDDAAGTLAFLSGELPRVKADLERAEAALTRYRTRSGSMQPSQDAQSYLGASMETQRQIAALRLERTKLLQRFTAEANEVRTVDSQIQQLTRERQELDARLQNLSMSERESVALTRDVKVAEDMYMTLRNKVEQLTLLQMDSASQVRVIDRALPPAMPAGPGPWPLTVGGAVLGLLLGVAGVSARARLKPSVANATDAEAKLGMAMLGDVAFSREQVALERLVDAKARLGIAAGFTMPAAARLARPQPGHKVAHAAHADAVGRDREATAEHLMRLGLHDHFLLARVAPHSLAVEGLRSVRAALHFGIRSAPDAVVAVTSPTPGSGKTFACVNLAVLFAETGQRVLLIDADLRRGKVATWFDQPAHDGLADMLAGRVPLADAIRPTVVGGLSILPAGMAPANPSELLMRPAMRDCLRACASRFDLVIVDTPPVMAVADATLVANLAGSTLVVVRADATPPDQVEETLKRLARADARLLGGILNGVTPRRSNRGEFSSINPYLGLPLPAVATRRAALVDGSA